MEACGSGQEAHIAAAGLAALRPAAAAICGCAAATLAQDGEGDVPPPAAVLWPAPVQDNRGLVDGGDHISGSRGRTWETERRGEMKVEGSGGGHEA